MLLTELESIECCLCDRMLLTELESIECCLCDRMLLTELESIADELKETKEEEPKEDGLGLMLQPKGVMPDRLVLSYLHLYYNSPYICLYVVVRNSCSIVSWDISGRINRRSFLSRFRVSVRPTSFYIWEKHPITRRKRVATRMSRRQRWLRSRLIASDSQLWSYLAVTDWSKTAKSYKWRRRQWEFIPSWLEKCGLGLLLCSPCVCSVVIATVCCVWNIR